MAAITFHRRDSLFEIDLALLDNLLARMGIFSCHNGYLSFDSAVELRNAHCCRLALSLPQTTPLRAGQPGRFEPGQVGSSLPGQVTRDCLSIGQNRNPSRFR